MKYFLLTSIDDHWKLSTQRGSNNVPFKIKIMFLQLCKQHTKYVTFDSNDKNSNKTIIFKKFINATEVVPKRFSCKCIFGNSFQKAKPTLTQMNTNRMELSCQKRTATYV